MRVLSCLAALAVVAVAGVAQAGEYMFSLSWEPAFCAAGHDDKTECRAITAESYDASHLVLHGLWPQNKQYCGVPKEIVDLDQSAATWGKMPAVTVSDALRQRMDKTFPGVVSYLDRHEWYKHGTCSGLTPEGYFSLALDLVDQANALKFGNFITANVGKSVAVDDVCGAMTNDFGSAFTRATTIRQGNGALSEVRFALRDTDKPLALDADHLSQGKKSVQCSGTMVIPAVGKTKS